MYPKRKAPAKRGPGGRPGDKRRDSKGYSGPGGGGRFFQKKTCRFCADRVSFIDYKDSDRLRRFLTEKGKVMPRRITGNCAKCQRMLARAIKRSRHSGLIAFQVE